MHLIVIHNNSTPFSRTSSRLLQFAASTEPIANILLQKIRKSYRFSPESKTIIALPEKWQAKPTYPYFNTINYNGCIPVPPIPVKKSKTNRWFVISDGRFVTNANWRRFGQKLPHWTSISNNDCKSGSNPRANLVALNIDQALLAYRENIRITSDNRVAGFRRLYSNSAIPTSIPRNWPHHIFVKVAVLDKILIDNALPPTFAEFASRCAAASIEIRCFNIAGAVIDLETEAGLLNFLTTGLHPENHRPYFINQQTYGRPNQANRCTISPDARIFGKIILGKNVRITRNAIVVGPTIIADNVKIAAEATVNNSIIGPNLSVPKRCTIRNRVLVGSASKRRLVPRQDNRHAGHLYKNFTDNELPPTSGNFRVYPTFSYPAWLKRIADIAASSAVLLLLAPLFPAIAVIIKLSSPGKVFFKHKRQGLHGKEFYCLKFRTMIVDADRIQSKLRFKNQADGPQFKLKDDPRTTLVGRFLRETFIDEIPQFINVLRGQMSLVGPRPSPKQENSLCPSWRDARLSVRPGITGLWQVNRTRRQGRDFQEWILYDTKYVRNLSLRLDLQICWQTTKMLVTNFINQF